MAFSIPAWRRWPASSSPPVPLQFQGLSVPAGDEAVIAAGGEEGQLGAGRGLHPPDGEPHRRRAGLTPERGAGGLRHSSGAVHPAGNRRPVRLGYRLGQVPQAGVLADGGWRMVMEKRTSIRRQTAATAWV